MRLVTSVVRLETSPERVETCPVREVTSVLRVLICWLSLGHAGCCGGQSVGVCAGGVSHPALLVLLVSEPELLLVLLVSEPELLLVPLVSEPELLLVLLVSEAGLVPQSLELLEPAVVSQDLELLGRSWSTPEL